MNDRAMSILTLAEDPAVARLIRKLLRATEHATADVHAVASVQEARNLAIDHASVVLVMMKFDQSNSAGLASMLAIVELYPDSTMVLLNGQDHTGFTVEAIREGAHSNMSEVELDADFLVRTLHSSSARHGFIQRLRKLDEVVLEHESRFIANWEGSASMRTKPDPVDVELYERSLTGYLRRYLMGDIDVPSGSDLAYLVETALKGVTFEDNDVLSALVDAYDRLHRSEAQLVRAIHIRENRH